jgi:glycosyltransferase involved in cell wall biosynthesis
MNLLITTQKVDYTDDNLGFFHDWIKEFAKHCEKVTVICLFKGACDLPANVEVISLGKTKEDYQNGSEGKFARRLNFIFKFYKTIWEKRRDYDAVFVHMNPEYVVLGGLFWKITGKKIGLWFTHKSVKCSLRIAEKFVDEIFTASKESFRLQSGKINVVGHGIDLHKFQISNNKHQINSKSEILNSKQIQNFKFKILTIGRISPSKDYGTLINAIKMLCDEGKGGAIEVKIVGGSGTKEQEEYFEKIKKDVKDKGLDGVIKFIGAVSANETPKFYQDADLFISTSLTGSLDKAVLEAMASGIMVASCNDSVVKDIFGEIENRFGFKKGDSLMLSQKIKDAMAIGQPERMKLGEEMRAIVKRDHEIGGLIQRICGKLS